VSEPSVQAGSDEFDSPWKEALERFFAEFIELFFPQAHREIDWSRGYDFLDQELQAVVRDAELGRRWADRLVRVWRTGGEDEWVLIHLEIQGQVDPDFARRMYVYNYRIFDRYNRKVASFAVLADDSKRWRPKEFRSELWGSVAGLKFPTAKSIDFDPDELERNGNPIALLVLAHLKTIATKRKQAERGRWKLRIIRDLYQRGMSRQEVLDLLRVIDWLMRLDPPEELRFEQAKLALEQELKMPYITSWERNGERRGQLQAFRQSVLDLLQERFGAVSETTVDTLDTIEDSDLMRRLVIAASTSSKPADFEKLLPKRRAARQKDA
jgi:hypothetical protein